MCFLMAYQERADKPILSVESGGPADIALCGQRFSSVALRRRLWPGLPFNFLSIGFFETDESILTNQYGVAS